MKTFAVVVVVVVEHLYFEMFDLKLVLKMY
jgi:hypothetical protein